MGPTNEQIAAVLRELMRAVAERGALDHNKWSELAAQLEPQAAPQRCVPLVPDADLKWCSKCQKRWHGELPPECKGAPKPAEVPGCGSPTCRWCGTGATNPAQPPKPRRVMIHPHHQPVPDAPSAAVLRELLWFLRARQTTTADADRLTELAKRMEPIADSQPKRRMMANPSMPTCGESHSREHDWNETCDKWPECQPVPDAPRFEAWVCVRSDKGDWFDTGNGNCYVQKKPLPSQEELARSAWDKGPLGSGSLEQYQTVVDAIYRELGVSDGK